jgi:STE24 endopeptidase
MLALQTTPISLSAAIVALAGFALIGGFLGAIGSVVVRRLRNPVGKYRLLYAAVLFPYTLLAYAVFALTGFGTALLTTLPAVPELVTRVLADFVTFLAAGCVWIISYLPTVRGIRDVRDVDLATSTSFRKMTRYAIGVSALLTVVLVPLQVVSIESSPLVLAFGLAALVVGCCTRYRGSSQSFVRYRHQLETLLIEWRDFRRYQFPEVAVDHGGVKLYGQRVKVCLHGPLRQ